jgi:hypothetical protein
VPADPPACSACGAAVPPSRAIYAEGTHVATSCPACLTVEEWQDEGPGSGRTWRSLRTIAPGAEVARERARFAEELAAGTLARRLFQDRQRFNRLAIPELFDAARSLFHRPAVLHRAHGIAIDSGFFPDVERRFLQDWRTPHVFAAGARAQVVGLFGDWVMLEAPDGGTPLCVKLKEVDLGMPDPRLVVGGPDAWDGYGPLLVAIDGETLPTGVHVDRFVNRDPYGGDDGRTWTVTLSDAGSAFYLVHRIEHWNPGYDSTERAVYRSEDRGRTWIRIAREAAEEEMKGAELLHFLEAKDRA